mmetsp:Transcript_16910/g.25386  ORF Transcript_16910/g.25386 Transcript_16910/m.25386 type:complete len:181 (+) Transcript_16910:80-622(+)
MQPRCIVPIILAFIVSAEAFSVSGRISLLPSSIPASSSKREMVRYDPSAEKWLPTSPEDEDGYGPVGTLLRTGPKPLIIRMLSPDNYEQGVYKLMANENMSRMEAQGNFDAYLENPNDWAYNYFKEKGGGYKKDYVNEGMDVNSLILKGTWSTLLLALAARGVYCYNTGEYFYDFLKGMF